MLQMETSKTAKKTGENLEFAIICQNLTRIYTRRIRESGLKGALKSFLHAKFTSKTAIQNLNLSIKKGSVTGLVGSNGAGKTTFLKMCAGLLHPSSGDLKVFGFVPSQREIFFQRKIGMVMGQKSQLWVDISAFETFELLASIYQVPESVFRTRVSEYSKIFQVEAYLHTQVRRLSLGERMKLEIIAALIHQPELLILDEPTIGLDVVARRAIREFIRTYNKETGTTIILSSHDMNDIEEVCDDLILVAEGKALYQGALSRFSKIHEHHKSFIEREIEFRFDLNKAPNSIQCEEIAKLQNAIVTETNTILAKFRVSKMQVADLISAVLKIATPIDIRIEGQKLESLIHDLIVEAAI